MRGDHHSAHLCLLSIVCIRFTCFDHLESILVQGFKVVRRVGDHIACDTEQGKILEDRVLKLSLYTGSVCQNGSKR